MITILLISAGFAAMNLLLLTRININLLLFLDIFIWTIMQLYLTKRLIGKWLVQRLDMLNCYFRQMKYIPKILLAVILVGLVSCVPSKKMVYLQGSRWLGAVPSNHSTRL